MMHKPFRKTLQLGLAAMAALLLTACASTYYYPVPESSAGVYYGEDSGYYDGYPETRISFGVYSGPFAFRHYDPFYGSYYGRYCGLYAYCHSNFALWPYRSYYWAHWSPFQSHYYYYYPVYRYPHHRRPYHDRPRRGPRHGAYSGRHPERGAEDELRAYEMTLEQRKELLKGPKEDWDEGEYKLEPERPTNRPVRRPAREPGKRPAEGISARPVERPGGSGRVIRSRPAPPPRAVTPPPVDISSDDRRRYSASKRPVRSEPIERRRPNINRPGYQPGEPKDLNRGPERGSRTVIRPEPGQRSPRARTLPVPPPRAPVSTGGSRSGGEARIAPRRSSPPPRHRSSSPPPAKPAPSKRQPRAIRSRPKAESPD